MNIDTYEILKKNIPQVKLVSLTSQNWYDNLGVLSPWSGSLYNGPAINDIYFNISSSNVTTGYYQWNGTRWIPTSTDKVYPSYNLPIFLETRTDELGPFVGFDGYAEQIEQIVNFTYKQNGNVVTLYNTVNPDKQRNIVDLTYTINWGDSQTSTISANTGVVGSNFPNVSHTYINSSAYTITLSYSSPWEQKKISKKINVPQYSLVENPLGQFIGVTVPAYTNATGQSQNYLSNLDYTNNTGNTPSGFTYMSIGKSRISEKKLYGANQYSGVTYGTDTLGSYTAYTIDNLYYKDYPDNYTVITGTTVGYTKEEVINKMITRNEHFLGFIEEPVVYSNVFIERGKQSVMENNLRLGEIDNTGELSVYQNEFFLIKKQ